MPTGNLRPPLLRRYSEEAANKGSLTPCNSSMVLRSNLPRSRILQLLPALLPAATWRPLPAIAVGGVSSGDQGQIAGDKAFQPGLAGKDYGKSEMSYDDFTKRPSGMAFKEAKPGNGKSPVAGDRVVVDWSGYTIGYFGRPFETKKLVELDGKDKAYLRFELGKGAVLPALEAASRRCLGSV